MINTARVRYYNYLLICISIRVLCATRFSLIHATGAHITQDFLLKRFYYYDLIILIDCRFMELLILISAWISCLFWAIRVLQVNLFHVLQINQCLHCLLCNFQAIIYSVVMFFFSCNHSNGVPQKLLQEFHEEEGEGAGDSRYILHVCNVKQQRLVWGLMFFHWLSSVHSEVATCQGSSHSERARWWEEWRLRRLPLVQTPARWERGAFCPANLQALLHPAQRLPLPKLTVRAPEYVALCNMMISRVVCVCVCVWLIQRMQCAFLVFRDLLRIS